MMSDSQAKMMDSVPNDDDASLYDADYFAGLPVESDRIQNILEYIRFSPTDQVCEFGSGLGHILFAIQNRIGFGLGVDFAQYAIQESRKRCTASGFTNLEFEYRDITDLPKKAGNSNRFDKVLMMDVTEHVDDGLLSSFLNSARQILKPTGELIIHTPNAGYFIEILKNHNFLLRQLPGHIAVRDLQHYEQLLTNCRFKVASVTFLPHYRGPIGQIDKILMRVPVLGSFFRSRLLVTAIHDS